VSDSIQFDHNLLINSNGGSSFESFLKVETFLHSFYLFLNSTLTFYPLLLFQTFPPTSEEYDPIHPPGTLEENLPKEKCLGKVDPSSVPKEAKKEQSQQDKQIARAKDEIPPLEMCLNLYDFEVSTLFQFGLAIESGSGSGRAKKRGRR